MVKMRYWWELGVSLVLGAFVLAAFISGYGWGEEMKTAAAVIAPLSALYTISQVNNILDFRKKSRHLNAK